jgi:nucleoside-diphosphate-sugar epimerase
VKRLIIAGFGDVARRALPLLVTRYEVFRLSRKHGFDLDRPETLRLEACLEAAAGLLYLAPPPPHGDSDPRTANLLAALEKGRILPARVVYVSTSGVYGDCRGARVDESRPVAPATSRGRRRADAERQLRAWCDLQHIPLVILRAPGIYAADRLPLQRLRAALPCFLREDDIYTSHIHADDLAAIAARALRADAPAGIYNASDDTELKMGDWLDLVADVTGLPRPPRVARADMTELNDFMTESRRLDNRLLKERLGVRLRYPTVYEGLKPHLNHDDAARTDQPA